MATVPPASERPLSTGVLSSVRPPSGIAVGVAPLSLLSARLVTAAGGWVSTFSAMTLLAGLTLPAASVTTALRLCAPSLSVGAVKLQLPSSFTVALPSTAVPSSTVTMLPASALPLSTGVLSLLRPPSGMVAPVRSLVSVSPVTASGAAVSTVKPTGGVVPLLLPAASVTLTLRLCGPLASVGVVKLQLPSGPTETEPIATSSS